LHGISLACYLYYLAIQRSHASCIVSELFRVLPLDCFAKNACNDNAEWSPFVFNSIPQLLRNY
jgi:hypothetical protein